mmetsp:Transcript_12579/g.30450  ORF Transcript_12579/g.30450 Transcript_12579/m.30450 type:complete len:81 (-) Transcript_12579:225-467(-)
MRNEKVSDRCYHWMSAWAGGGGVLERDVIRILKPKEMQWGVGRTEVAKDQAKCNASSEGGGEGNQRFNQSTTNLLHMHWP